MTEIEICAWKMPVKKNHTLPRDGYMYIACNAVWAAHQRQSSLPFIFSSLSFYSVRVFIFVFSFRLRFEQFCTPIFVRHIFGTFALNDIAIPILRMSILSTCFLKYIFCSLQCLRELLKQSIFPIFLSNEATWSEQFWMVKFAGWNCNETADNG